ncbi:MAG: hypothetical protein GTO18_09455 [Anaerolineales bacterium]|nr:hypothetical protein [Anaerolineales bacterium]
MDKHVQEKPPYAEIHRWDEDGGDWVALTTTVDPGRDIATVQTTTPGRYELLAPRNIPEDVTEPDDDYNASTTIPTDGTALSRYFDIPEDEDWFALHAVAGMFYEIETVNLAPGVGTVMELYDQDGFSILLPSVASVIEGESRLTLEGSLLEWQAPYSGTYFIRVYPAPGSIIGAESTYQLVMHQEARIYLPTIQR